MRPSGVKRRPGFRPPRLCGRGYLKQSDGLLDINRQVCHASQALAIACGFVSLCIISSLSQVYC